MKPFDENACCPKCKGSDIRSVWNPYDEHRWLHRAFPEVTVKDEHILRVCQRCNYKWAEAPMDAEQARIERLRAELAAEKEQGWKAHAANLSLEEDNDALCEENARLRGLLAECDAALSWVLLEGIDEACPTTCPVEYARIVDAAKAIAAAIREGGKD